MRIGNTFVSLNALHTFAAAARHCHMGRAAQELNVTQSAVSHQIRALERDLGATLFQRRGRHVELTGAGTRLLSTVQQAFDSIAATVLTLEGGLFQGELTLAAPVSFLTEWLTPRLPEFLDAFPNLSLRTEILDRHSAGPPTEADIAVTFDRFAVPGRTVAPLLELTVFPVCAPAVAPQTQPVRADSLSDATLIHEDDGALWDAWFAAAAAGPVTPRRHIHAGALNLALELARQAVGFAISDEFMSSRDLAEGRLVRPWGRTTLDHARYYLVTRTGEDPSSPAAAFALWLHRRVAADRVGRTAT